MCVCNLLITIIIFLLFISGQKQGIVFSSNSPNDNETSRDTSAENNTEEAFGDGPPEESIVLVPVRFRRFNLDSHCGLRAIQLQVQDLGLGYDSDETVLFKYCYGTCPYTHSNYDLTLTNLRLSGVLRQPASEDIWHNTRCCRPTHLEDTAFLDNLQHWHKLEKLSAAGCGCIG